MDQGKGKEGHLHIWIKEKLPTKPVQQSPTKTVQEKKRKDYHRHRRCPINGCNSVDKRLANHIQQVHKEIKKGSPVDKQILREARSLKTWQSSRKAQGLPSVKGEGSFSNSTEEGSMGDSSVQDLPHLGQYEEEDDEVQEVENEETEELQEEEEKARFLSHFAGPSFHHPLFAATQKWQNSIARSCARSFP